MVVKAGVRQPSSRPCYPPAAFRALFLVVVCSFSVVLMLSFDACPYAVPLVQLFPREPSYQLVGLPVYGYPVCMDDLGPTLLGTGRFLAAGYGLRAIPYALWFLRSVIPAPTRIS